MITGPRNMKINKKILVIYLIISLVTLCCGMLCCLQKQRRQQFPCRRLHQHQAIHPPSYDVPQPAAVPHPPNQTTSQGNFRVTPGSGWCCLCVVEQTLTTGMLCGLQKNHLVTMITSNLNDASSSNSWKYGPGCCRC